MLQESYSLSRSPHLTNSGQFSVQLLQEAPAIVTGKLVLACQFFWCNNLRA